MSEVFQDLENIEELEDLQSLEDVEVDDVELEDAKVEEKEIPNTSRNVQKKKVLGIRGYVLLSVVNIVFPNLFVAAANFLNINDQKVHPNEIKLDDDELKDLEPLADEVVKEITFSPSTMLIFSLFVMYYTKFEMAKRMKNIQLV